MCYDQLYLTYTVQCWSKEIPVHRQLSTCSLKHIMLKVTRHICFINSKNLQLLDVQACNSAKGSEEATRVTCEAPRGLT